MALSEDRESYIDLKRLKDVNSRIDPTAHTLKDLKDYLRSNYLPVSGNKSEIVKRVKDYITLYESVIPEIASLSLDNSEEQEYTESYNEGLLRRYILTITEYDNDDDEYYTQSSIFNFKEEAKDYILQQIRKRKIPFDPTLLKRKIRSY